MASSQIVGLTCQILLIRPKIFEFLSKTIIEKVKMAKDYGLGGIMNWAIDIDDFKGTFCGQEAIFDSATHYHTFAIMSGLSKIVFSV